MKLLKKICGAFNQLAGDKVKSIISHRRKPKSNAPPSEEVKTDLERAVSEKDAGRYTEALHIVDEVLKRHPNIPVAALIKAAILWEGFKDPYTAKLGLQRVKQLVPNKKDRLNRMASELMAEIESSRKAK